MKLSNPFEWGGYNPFNPIRNFPAKTLTAFHSLSRTVVLFISAFFFLIGGISEMWAGTKRIYFDYSNVTTWTDDNAKLGVHCWGGDVTGADYDMYPVEGQSNLIFADIDEGHASLCFYRKNPENVEWWNQTQDWGTIGTYNRFKIKNSKGEYGTDANKYLWADSESAIRWTPSPAIDGLLDPNNPHNQAFVEGVFETTLEAHSTYEFKVLDGSTLYGLDNNVWTSSVADYGLNSGQYQIRLCTAGAGKYTFTYNSSSHQLSVTYPVVQHPSKDYCYVINYSWDPSTNIHLWNSSSSVAGTTSPGTQLYNTTTIYEQSFFYIAPGDYANFLVSKNGDNTDRTGDLSTSDGYGKRRYYNGSAWVWDTFSVRIQLNDLSATTSVVPNYMDVAFNSDVLTNLTTVPEKTNYDFGGFYTNSDGTGTQVIDASGHWIASVADYTDASKHWIHAGTTTTLYAKWTETPRTITLQVSPSGAGTVSPTGTVTAYIVTPSATITATPNPGWKFKEWQYGTNVGPYSGTGTDNTVQVTATVNGTLTAVFEPRYYLVGGEITGEGDDGTGTESGMSGWNNYEVPFNVITTSPILATCSLTLGTNKHFYIMVRDKADGLSYGKSEGTLGDDASITFTDQDNRVLFHSNGGTNYTFKITGVDGSGRPTVAVERPHQMHIGYVHAEIDNTSATNSGNTGGTLTASIGGSPIANEAWFNYGSNISYTASPVTGYTPTWYSNNTYTSAFGEQPANSWTNNNVTGDENVYVRFTEKATTVNLANDGHGHVEIGTGNTVTQTTVGVTTTRSLNAVPDEAYKFDSWTKVSGDDITLSSTSTNPTTLTGLGAGAASGQEVRANFTYRYSIKGTMNGENWGTDHFITNIGTNADGKDTGYVEMNLPANATYEFAIQDLTGVDIWLKNGVDAVYNMTYTNHTNWLFATDKTYNCGIITAGKGTYKFIFNITDKKVTVVYPTSYQVNYGASVGGSVTSVVDDDDNSVPNGGYVRSGGSVTYTATPANAYYTFAGWYSSSTLTGDPFNTDEDEGVGSWTNNNVTETQNSFARFNSTNFVIYRTGDKAEDSRAAVDDVESYAGGTIAEVIEYRMKVHELDTWYTLCLPFTVNGVKVWDPDDGPAYFDIVPYYRTEAGLFSGHYFIRTPLPDTTGLAIANFDDWNDPNTAAYMPIERVPYIIQWHDSYFLGKYISFFGATGQEIPTRFRDGVAPNDNNVVNVYGNNTMHTGSVPGAYMLEPDYGSDGAWLRLENASESRTIPPFECFIRASEPVTISHIAIRRGMSLNDLSTGETVIADNHIAPLIRVYTLSGIMVTQFTDCSFSQAAYVLSMEQPAGIYILSSDQEAVKVIVGGK